MRILKFPLIALVFLSLSILQSDDSQLAWDERKIDLKQTSIYKRCKDFEIPEYSSVNMLKKEMQGLKEGDEIFSYHKCKCSVFKFISDYSNAEVSCSSALKLIRDIDILEDRVEIYMKLGKIELAISDLNEIINSKDFEPKARNYSNRGNLHNSKGHYIKALNDFDSAIILSDDPTYKFSKSKVLFNLNQKNEACQILDSIIKSNAQPLIKKFLKVEEEYKLHCSN